MGTKCAPLTGRLVFLTCMKIWRGIHLVARGSYNVPMSFIFTFHYTEDVLLFNNLNFSNNVNEN